MEPLRKGTVFADRYEIVRPIAAGGMGAVYEAIHRGTERKRALKVMLPSLMTDDDMRARFRREAVVTAEIESEHLVEIFDAGIDETTGAPYLVMELLRGEDLYVRLSRLGTLPKDEVVSLMRQAARALDKTHRAGVIHRDLKPENLFLTTRDDGSARLKILDFGIAKLVKRVTEKGKTRAIGSPLYMSPEQSLGDSAKIGPASDLYALGHIVFALLVGSPYFATESDEADNVLALLLTISRGLPEPAHARAKRFGVELPRAFDAWFSRATALSPADRFEGASAMIDALEEALSRGEIEVTSSDRRLIGTLPTLDAGSVSSSSSPSSAFSPSPLTAALSPAPTSAPATARTAHLRTRESSTGGEALEPQAPAPTRKQTVGKAVVGAALGGLIAAGFTTLVRMPGRDEVHSSAPIGEPPSTVLSVTHSGDSARPAGGPAVTPTTSEPAPSETAGPAPTTTSSSAVATARPSALTKPSSTAKSTATVPTIPLPKTAAPTGTVWIGPRR